jgi:hypothetical protein
MWSRGRGLGLDSGLGGVGWDSGHGAQDSTSFVLSLWRRCPTGLQIRWNLSCAKQFRYGKGTNRDRT